MTELYNTSRIDFKKIRESINANTETIKNTSSELGRYLMVDEKLKLGILPEFHDRARQIQEEIANLRNQNAEALEYMNFVSDLLPKFGIEISKAPVWINGQFVEMPIYADLEILTRRVNTEYSTNVSKLKKDFANHMILAADFERSKETATEEWARQLSKLTEVEQKLKDYINKNINIKVRA